MDELKNKRWLLTAPADMSELFLALRYLQILPERESVVLLTEAVDNLGLLLEASFPWLKVSMPGAVSPSAFDIQYDLARLPYLLKCQATAESFSFSIPYLKSGSFCVSEAVLKKYGKVYSITA